MSDETNPGCDSSPTPQPDESCVASAKDPDGTNSLAPATAPPAAAVQVPLRPPFVWCLVANVKSEPQPERAKGEMRLGTKHFAAGAKLYCFPPRWGDGGERLHVLGMHRGSGPKLIKMVAASKRLTNWRAKQVYHPSVVRTMEGYWDASDGSQAQARELAEAFTRRERCHRSLEDEPGTGATA